jgi:hypothetical protein
MGTANADWGHQHRQVQAGRRECGKSFAAPCGRADQADGVKESRAF